MPTSLKYVLLALVLLLLATIPLAKQFENGTIEGFVSDDAGAVAGASVEATNLASGAFLRSASDNTGYYQMEGVRPGRYSLMVEEERHAPFFVPAVIVVHGESAREDVRLQTVAERTPTSMRR